MVYIAVFNDAYLEHHGVKGMRWGVRRRRSDEYYEERAEKRKKRAKVLGRSVAGLALATGAAYGISKYRNSGRSAKADLSAAGKFIGKAAKAGYKTTRKVVKNAPETLRSAKEKGKKAVKTTKKVVSVAKRGVDAAKNTVDTMKVGVGVMGRAAAGAAHGIVDAEQYYKKKKRR